MGARGCRRNTKRASFYSEIHGEETEYQKKGLRIVKKSQVIISEKKFEASKWKAHQRFGRAEAHCTWI